MFTFLYIKANSEKIWKEKSWRQHFIWDSMLTTLEKCMATPGFLCRF